MPYLGRRVKNFCRVCGKEFDAKIIHSNVQKTCGECRQKLKQAKYERCHCSKCGRHISVTKPVKICSFCEKRERKLNRERKEHYPQICQRCGKPIYHNTCDCSLEGKKPLRQKPQVIKKKFCEKCGSTEKLERHHLLDSRWREFLKYKVGVNENHTVTLCHSCHQKEHKREQPQIIEVKA